MGMNDGRVGIEERRELETDFSVLLVLIFLF